MWGDPVKPRPSKKMMTLNFAVRKNGKGCTPELVCKRVGVTRIVQIKQNSEQNDFATSGQGKQSKWMIFWPVISLNKFDK